MTDTVTLDTSNYLNVQGITGLKNRSVSQLEQTQHEVAQQFESMLVQLLLKSMRDANKAFTNNEESAAGHELYQDLFDKQVGLSMAHQGLGLSNAIERYLKQVQPTSVHQESAKIDALDAAKNQPQLIKNPPQETTTTQHFSTQLEFIKSLWNDAKKAASQLGLDPKLLVAQAALETGWGKSILTHESEGSSYNLFNIKADSQWDKKTITKNTLEEYDGLITKEKSAFRAYSSYGESFNDYVSFIKSNPRYEQALSLASNPEIYMQKLQEASYATDSSYSDKVLEIYKGDRLNNLFKEANLV